MQKTSLNIELEKDSNTVIGADIITEVTLTIS